MHRYVVPFIRRCICESTISKVEKIAPRTCKCWRQVGHVHSSEYVFTCSRSDFLGDLIFYI
jgi:hypothetical protein